MKSRLPLLSVLMAGALCAQSTHKGPAGHWEGALQNPHGDMKIEVDLREEAGSGWIGAITIPAQNTKGLRLNEIKVMDAAVSFAIKAPGDPRFQGTVAAEGGKISGEMQQGDFKLPFQLTRNGEAKIEKAVAIPAMSKDLEGTWEGTLNAGGKLLRLLFLLANEGTAGTGKLFSIDQGNAEIPVSRIRKTEAQVLIEASVISGSFEGELKGSTLTGRWTQGPGGLPLRLTKAAAKIRP